MYVDSALPWLLAHKAKQHRLSHIQVYIAFVILVFSKV